MKKDIILTEKPSVATSIKDVIAPYAARRNGYYEDQKYLITWAFGHLLELAEPHLYDPKYEKWVLADLPIIPDAFRLNVIKNTKDQFKVIKQLITSPDSSSLILATDAGREGQLIGEYIYLAAGCKLPVKRLWNQSWTEEAIKKGFANLKPGSDYKRLADAARCRSEMDWIIGINCTRAMTKKCNVKINVGRVVTPTLALIVSREKEIKDFKNQKFYELIAQFEGKYSGKWIKNNETRIATKQEAEALRNKLAGKKGIVKDIEIEEKQDHPPLLHDLAALQKEANKLLGYSSAKTLKLAQSLYQTHKLLSYPRTDCRYLDSSQKEEIPDIAKAIREIPDLKGHFPKQFIITNRTINDKKMEGSDHHAIIPTEEKPDLSKLTLDEKNIYFLVARRFLAAFLPSYKYKKTVITTEVEGEIFYTVGNEEQEIGWKVLYLQDKKEEDPEENDVSKNLPQLKKGQLVTTDKIDIREGETGPPKRYTEATLLAAMESAGKFVDDEDKKEILRNVKGIGTPATRSEIIEKLIKEKYVDRKGKSLIPTEFGIKVIEVMPVQDMVSVELTADWEQKLKDIELGKTSRGRLSQEIRDYCKYLIDTIKSSDNTDLASDKNVPVGKCPDCGGDIIEKSKGYFCENKLKNTCDFPAIYKIIAKKKLPKTAVKQLITKKETSIIKGFKNNKDEEFDSKLKITDQQVKFAK